MGQLTANCPRCHHAHVAFDANYSVTVGTRYSWDQRICEVFAVCRNCGKSTVFVVAQENSGPVKPPQDYASVNDVYKVEGHIAISDMIDEKTPEHLPENIAQAFREAAVCKSVKCYNAAGTMFRLCVDLATRPLLPPEEPPVEGLSKKARRDLGLRLPWLFATGKLPKDLEGLSDCIREDGNDGAHQGTLKSADTEDLHDFTVALMTRMFTEPEKVRLAKERREKRREKG